MVDYIWAERQKYIFLITTFEYLIFLSYVLLCTSAEPKTEKNNPTNHSPHENVFSTCCSNRQKPSESYLSITEETLCENRTELARSVDELTTQRRFNNI